MPPPSEEGEDDDDDDDGGSEGGGGGGGGNLVGSDCLRRHKTFMGGLGGLRQPPAAFNGFPQPPKTSSTSVSKGLQRLLFSVSQCGCGTYHEGGTMILALAPKSHSSSSCMAFMHESLLW
jgi:hypothetical protein